MNREVELEVLKVIQTESGTNAYALILGEVNGKRRLPIIIGAVEAQAISNTLRGVIPMRPITHDLFAFCLETVGSRVESALIYKVENGIFFAYIILEVDGRLVNVDARSADAIALAVRFSAPIVTYEALLEKECMPILANGKNLYELEEEEDKESIEYLQKELQKAVDEENYELASLLRDKIAEMK
jgi:bifunctional DNase/RNase